ncbi:MAG: hypothetical protein B7X10_00105 [Burkholderiales bacterium 21-58-4]|nr:MAG: hypothetical protein B7X10_00105 [Burkholderiales bacterium 21-58-4]
MTIWVANTTRQEQELHVRLPEMSGPYICRISSGRQGEVKNLSPAQEEAFIAHLARYGAAKRADLHGKVKGFQGISYATDKAFKMDEFHYGHEEVLDTAQDRSVEEAVRSALAADMKMRDPSTGERLSLSTEVEMAEERAPEGKKGKRMKVTVDPKTKNQAIPLQ